MAYFSTYFDVSKETLDSYGAVDISLNCDSNLFIDPCLIYANKEYKKLHEEIVEYFLFLKDLKESGVSFEEFSLYCNFHEICNTWLGYSVESNKGRGLSTNFAFELYNKISELFNFTQSDEHIEKVFLFSERTSSDRISDLITNIILEFLCLYTMEFVKKYLSDSSKIDTFNNINIKQKDGEIFTDVTKEYILPYIIKVTNYKNKPPKTEKEFVLLVPKNIVRVKHLELSNTDFRNHYNDIDELINDNFHREQINRMYDITISEENKKRNKKLTRSQENKIKRELFYSYAQDNPEVLEYYLLYKEKTENLEEAKRQSSIEYMSEMEKTMFLTNDFLKRNNIEKLIPDLIIPDFIDMIKNYFSQDNNNINYNLISEQDLNKFINHIAFNIYGISSSKIKKNNLLIKFSRNFIRKDSKPFIDYLSGNQYVILFCSSEEDKKDLIEFLKNKKLNNEINKSIHIIDYYEKEK